MISFKKFFHPLLDLLFPLECLNCQKEGAWLCPECLKKIKIKSDFECLVCGKNSFQGLMHKKCQGHSKVTGMVVALDWQNQLVKNLIHKYKFNALKDLHQPLSQLLLQKINESPLLLSWLTKTHPLLIPIPLHKRRLLERGFNQSQLLAQKLALALNLTLGDNFLIRTRATQPQTKLKAEKRQENVKDAFQVTDINQIKNKNIILVDDVTTTGATLEEAARVLKKAQAQTIWAVVLARG